MSWLIRLLIMVIVFILVILVIGFGVNGFIMVFFLVKVLFKIFNVVEFVVGFESLCDFLYGVIILVLYIWFKMYCNVVGGGGVSFFCLVWGWGIGCCFCLVCCGGWGVGLIVFLVVEDDESCWVVFLMRFLDGFGVLVVWLIFKLCLFVLVSVVKFCFIFLIFLLSFCFWWFFCLVLNMVVVVMIVV